MTLPLTTLQKLDNKARRSGVSVFLCRFCAEEHYWSAKTGKTCKRVGRVVLNCCPAERERRDAARNAKGLQPTSVAVESSKLIARQIKELARPTPDTPSGSLLEMFNTHLVDFVRQEGDKYIPLEWPGRATHQLVPTLWNKEPTPNTPASEVYALSVCANPLRIRHVRTELTVKKLFPKRPPIYKVDAEVSGKRNVLKFLIVAMGAPLKLKKSVEDYDTDDCDLLYNRLIRASRALQERKGRKAQHAESI